MGCFVDEHVAWYGVLELVLREQLVAPPHSPRHQSIRIDSHRCPMQLLACFLFYFVRCATRLELEHVNSPVRHVGEFIGYL